MGWGRARFYLIFGLIWLFLAGALTAFVDASEDAGYASASLLASYPADVVVANESGSWQFSGRSAGNGPAFPGATTFAAALTDFYHWSRFWQMTILSLGAVFLFWCGYYWPVNLRGFTRFLLGVVLLAAGHLMFLGGHAFVWDVALPSGGSEIAQAIARPWVDLFINVHTWLQSRDFLG